jgi:hypothetical protein
VTASFTLEATVKTNVKTKKQTVEAESLCAWEVEINYLTCIVFAATKPKAKWLAVKSYWDAYSYSGSWPHTSVARRPQYDCFPYREPKAYSPEYVRVTDYSD